MALQIPRITEDDLVAFQYKNFGDDTKPNNWFVSAEDALSFERAEEAKDDLGYCEDGTKRTLTDEQIALFRHSEIEQLLRERRLQREQEEEEQEAPASQSSSLEDDLLCLVRTPPKPVAKSRASRRLSKAKRHRSQRSNSKSNSTSTSSGSQSTTTVQHQRKKAVPYYERNKRKWEHYINDNDPVHGSMTHRRLVRELDEQHDDAIDVDYDEPVPTRAEAEVKVKNLTAGRRVISYGDG